MGVLEPLKEKSNEMFDISDMIIGNAKKSLRTLKDHADIILYSDMQIEQNSALKLLNHSDVSEIESEEEMENELSDLKYFIESVSREREINQVAMELAQKKDIEPDQDNPIQSWEDLGKLEREIDKVPKILRGRYDQPDEYTKEDVEEIRWLLDFAETFDGFPVIEGAVESQEMIQFEREMLMAEAAEEHVERSLEYRSQELPAEPVDWEKIIEAQDLEVKEYMDIEGIHGATYGDTLHLMMEEAIESVDRVESEYPLHFLNPGDETDVPKPNRLDNTVRPDAVDDLFVYDFKHMPWHQKQKIEDGKPMARDHTFVRNIGQMNGYLNDMDLPAGLIVYVSSDMDVEELVVAQHRSGLGSYVVDFYRESYGDKYVHRREDYDFDDLLKQL